MGIFKFDNKYEGKNFSSISNINELQILKNNIMLDIKVASLGIVRKLSEDMCTAQIDLFPHFNESSNRYIDCVNNVDKLEPGDCVIILFLDYNFLQNLQQYRFKQKMSYLNDINETHSEKFGIVISKINTFGKEGV